MFKCSTEYIGRVCMEECVGGYDNPIIINNGGEEEEGEDQMDALLSNEDNISQQSMYFCLAFSCLFDLQLKQ